MSESLAVVEKRYDGALAIRYNNPNPNLMPLEAEKATLEARLADRPAQEKPLLHPKMGEVYRKAVGNLRETLETGSDRAEAVNLPSQPDRPDRAAARRR